MEKGGGGRKNINYLDNIHPCAAQIALKDIIGCLAIFSFVVLSVKSAKKQLIIMFIMSMSRI